MQSLTDDWKLEQWTPKTEFPLLNKSVTRLLWGEFEVCNALEYADWTQRNRVQLQLCDQCFISGCESGRYINISRIGENVLWTAPDVNPDTIDDNTKYPHELLYSKGAVIIPFSIWDEWRKQVPELPDAIEFAPATRHNLAQAWLWHIPLDKPKRTLVQLDQVIPWLKECLVASDSFDKNTALENIRHIIEWFQESPDTILSGKLVPVTEMNVHREILYLEDPQWKEWAAWAVIDGKIQPILGKDWLYVPNK